MFKHGRHLQQHHCGNEAWGSGRCFRVTGRSNMVRTPQNCDKPLSSQQQGAAYRHIIRWPRLLLNPQRRSLAPSQVAKRKLSGEPGQEDGKRVSTAGASAPFKTPSSVFFTHHAANDITFVNVVHLFPRRKDRKATVTLVEAAFLPPGSRWRSSTAARRVLTVTPMYVLCVCEWERECLCRFDSSCASLKHAQGLLGGCGETSGQVFVSFLIKAAQIHLVPSGAGTRRWSAVLFQSSSHSGLLFVGGDN